MIARSIDLESTTREARPGLRLLALGLALGTLADFSLRSMPWGLNATVLAMSLLAVILWLQTGLGTRVGGGRIGHALAALVFAVSLAWRDAVVLKVLDVLSLVAALGLLASEREGLRASASLAGYLLRWSGTLTHAAIGPPLLAARDVDWSRFRLGSLGHVLLVLLGLGRGLAITLPILLLFTTLLASADPVFGLRIAELLNIDLPAVLGHLAGISVCAWIAAGLLRAAVLRDRPAHAFPPRPPWLALGRIETALLLASLDLLFAGFVWIQLRYLFGGAECVEKVAGLTYAEYARRGFFELSAVTALVLPLLLTAHWLLNPQSRAQKRMFGALAGAQVLLVLVMLASALERMRLYRAEYGLTQLRFYTTAFMAWLGVLLALFLLTVLRGRRDSFARGTLVSAFVVVFVLHGVDPEACIVRANASRGREFDVDYALGLGADAVPALLDTVASLDPVARATLARAMLDRWSAPEPDWRTWSVARARARQALERVEGQLRALAATEPAYARP